MQQIGPRDLAERLSDASREAPLLLDVREPWEFEICHIDGSVLLPMASVPEVSKSGICLLQTVRCILDVMSAGTLHSMSLPSSSSAV